MQRMYENRMYYGNQQRDCRRENEHYHKDNDGDTVKMTSFPCDYSVAMAYIPFQTCTEIYDECKALEEGTLFVSLNKPFLGRCCK